MCEICNTRIWRGEEEVLSTLSHFLTREEMGIQINEVRKGTLMSNLKSKRIVDPG